MKYWAFLSYSHKNKVWAAWLHRRLETYRVPRHLAGRASRDGQVPERLYPVFRDREELPVSADLGANITEALRESRYLLVVCSPRAARSRWVGEEIKTFKRLGREDRILALVVDGEPNAGAETPGSTESDERFPEALRFRLGPNGGLSSERTEPIAADVRPGGDGKNDAFLKILAGLLGVNYDELKKRDEARRRRRQRQIFVAGLVLLSVFAGLAALASWEWLQAERRKDQAERQRAAAEGLVRSILVHIETSINPSDEKQSAILVNLKRSLAEYDAKSALSPYFAREVSLDKIRSRIKRGDMLRELNNEQAALGELREAREELVRLSQAGPPGDDEIATLVDVHNKIAALLEGRGDETGAQEQLERAIRLCVEHPRATNPEFVSTLRQNAKRLSESTQVPLSEH